MSKPINQRRLFVLLPAYNEAESLDRLLRKIVASAARMTSNFTIVVCNDGSRDGSIEILNGLASEMPLVVLTHKYNRGLGETIRDLFEYAADHAVDDDIIIRMDCDDTHDPIYMPALAEKILGGADVAIASRFQGGGGQHGVSWYRAFISACATVFMRTLFPIPEVREYTCAYRAYSGFIVRQAVKRFGGRFVQLSGLGFTVSLEKTVKMHMLGARFAEIPFELRYDQKVGPSKMALSVTTLGYFVLAALYHWPFGGWRPTHRGLPAAVNAERP